jgi:hypothetical protein
LVFNVIDAHFRYSSGHYAPWSLHSIQNVSVTHGMFMMLYRYSCFSINRTRKVPQYNWNIIDSEVKQPYFISILPLSIIFHSILEMFRLNSFFFILYYPLQNITTFLQVKKTQNQTYCRLITITTQNQYGYYDNTSYYSSYNT